MPLAAAKSSTTSESKEVKPKAPTVFMFNIINYILMFAGIALLILGFVLMSGTTDIFSDTKITVAPILVLIGFAVGGFAIMYQPKKTTTTTPSPEA